MGIRESLDLSANPIDILNKLHTRQNHSRIHIKHALYVACDQPLAQVGHYEISGVAPKLQQRSLCRLRSASFGPGGPLGDFRRWISHALYVACDQPLAQVGHYEISGVGYHTLSMSPAISLWPRWAIMRFQALYTTFTLCHQISLGPVCALITYEYSFSILSKHQQHGGDSILNWHHCTNSSLFIYMFLIFDQARELLLEQTSCCGL